MVCQLANGACTSAVIFGRAAPGPLCDADGDGECDILAANAEIFGADAYCERFPL